MACTLYKHTNKKLSIPKQETTNNITVYRIKKVYMYMAIF